jgi:hypothetical protein
LQRGLADQRVAGTFEDALRGRVGEQDAPGGVQQQHAFGHVFDQRAHAGLAFVLRVDGPVQLDRRQFVGDDGGQVAQRGLVLGSELARPAVHHAERAEPAAIRRGQWHAGVETDHRLAGDQRIVQEARIDRGVLDHHHAVLADRMAAEIAETVGLRDIKAMARLEPLAVGIDQADQGDRDVEQAGGKTRDTVETLLGRRVEDVQAEQHLQALRFFVVRRCCWHGQWAYCLRP